MQGAIFDELDGLTAQVWDTRRKRYAAAGSIPCEGCGSDDAPMIWRGFFAGGHGMSATYGAHRFCRPCHAELIA